MSWARIPARELPEISSPPRTVVVRHPSGSATDNRVPQRRSTGTHDPRGRRSVRARSREGPPTREQAMADKSPRHSMSKKSAKSIKEKRTERKAKADAASQVERLTRDKKH